MSASGSSDIGQKGTLSAEIFDRVTKAVQEAHLGSIDRKVPDVVFHLTDVDGVLGIATSKCLWASLATSLNDASEVQYGILLAKNILSSRGAVMTAYESNLLKFLTDPTSVPSEVRFEQDPFVVAFCGFPARSGQWLHYGRSGRGVALGFAREIGDRPNYELVRVDYDPGSQRARMTALIDSVKPVLSEIRREHPAVSSERPEELAAIRVSFAIKNLSAHLKHPSFAEEDEYRLIGADVTLNGKAVGLSEPSEFRRSGDGLVPFHKVSFIDSMLKALVLGYSTPLSVEAARVLLRENGLNPVLARSVVPVR